jgi:hypothetical protein
MLVYIDDGSKTNYILNVLLESDVTLWRNKFLELLVAKFENFCGEQYDQNRLLLSYNPIMSIALSADLLMRIANKRRRFADECMNLKNSILDLGKVYNEKIEDESYYRELILDKDFRGRTVLSIICNLGLG